MSELRILIAMLAVITGTIFALLGVAGYLRFPDVYSRLHATGKVGVFGVVLLLIAAINLGLLGILKAIVLIVMLLVAGPVTSHVLASAAYRIGIPLVRAIRNDLNASSARTSDPSGEDMVNLGG